MSATRSASSRRHFRACLALLLILSLLIQPALGGQPPAAVAAPAPTAAELAPAQEAPQPAVRPAVEPAVEPAAGQLLPAIDCSKPIPGQKAKLFAEDEIMVSYRHRDSDQSLRSLVLDNSGSGLALLGSSKYYGTISGLTNVGWLGNTAADLDGDGSVEAASALRDASKRIAVTSDRGGVYALNWGGDAFKGDNVKWVNTAAGNLDRSANGDQEVVVAFADNNNDIEVSFLKGGGRIVPNNMLGTFLGDWNDPNDEKGRGNVSDVAVATGDLNGDGFDDEVVTVFRDGNADLQALILRRNADGTVTVLWNRSWTNHERGNVARDASYWRNKRPIDVNTGDFYGDLRDEVVIGFRSGDEDREAWNGKVQMLVLDLTGETKGATPAADTFAMDDRVFLERDLNSHYAEAATSVSIAGGDLDGDGRDEIALAYNTIYSNSDHDSRRWQQHLESYEYVDVREPGWAGCLDDAGAPRACLQMRSGAWNSPSATVPFGVSEANVEALVVMDTGDLDLDGKAEIALARQYHDNGDVEVYAFDADSGLNKRTMYTISSGDNRIEDFWLAMGDYNGDSWFGTYTGQCRLQKEVRVNAVVHAPPYWPEVNEDEVEAAFGQNVSGGGGSGKTTETSVGASVTMKYQIDELGPSFTHEWEKSMAVGSESMTTTVDGTGFTTHPIYLYGDEAYFSAVGFAEMPYWCYDYTEPHIGTMTVCTPRPQEEAIAFNYPTDWWYAEAPALYPDSWVPLGMNLAQGRSAEQSGQNLDTPAARAVDGNTNGDLNAGSVAKGAYTVHPWWQVDLGGEKWLDAIQLWNRSDCCAEQLANFYVFVANEPFASEDPNVLLADPEVWHYAAPGQAGASTMAPVNRHGRYVRVQLAGAAAANLQLAEVQVYGMPGAVDQWPTTRPITGTDTFQVTWPGGRTQTVNGQLLYSRQGLQLGLRAGSGAGEFDLGIAQEGEFVQEGSSASMNSLGMELRHSSSEVSAGTTNRTSYVLSWSKEVEFSGAAGGLPRGTAAEYNYGYMPYVWLQRARTSAGINQAFLVLDYWVPSVGAALTELAAASDGEMAGQAAGAVPQAPLLDSATHPDPAAWVTSATAAFTWAQPAGDPAIVEGYHWRLGRPGDPAPVPINLGPETSRTYYELDDGEWVMRVRGLGDGGEWSPAAERTIRVDSHPPRVTLVVEPAEANGSEGWYTTAVTVSASAEDGAGAGVTAIEVSPDGAAWQPYTGPLVFTADTPGTAVYARAVDGAGLASEPVSVTFKIDLTAPNSRVTGGQGPGAWLSSVITNTMGNQELMLLGALADLLSGDGGMSIRYDDRDWTTADGASVWRPFPAQPEIEANWAFTAQRLLGAGNHIFFGRGQDLAGNLEDVYEIGRVLWFPQAAPDLQGSTLTASAAVARPGDTVEFALVARNGGRQEAHVAATANLPAGLEVVTETLALDAVYDPRAGAIAWPQALLWPGDWERHTFSARVTASGAGVLATGATLHAAWPNEELLAPEDQERFRVQERTVQVAAPVTVDPNLPAAADVTAPWVTLNAGPALVQNGTISVGLVAAPDVQRMYLREWALDPASGAWTVMRSSGWIGYTPVYSWTLSPGQGVKYLGAWVADGAGNISVLDEGSMAFVNRVDGPQALAAGQRVQYRGDMERGNWVLAVLTTLAGDPDMYIWRPGNTFRPDFYSNDSVAPGQAESLGGQMIGTSGRFLLEVLAAGDSEYSLDLSGQGPASAVAAGAAAEKDRPSQPLSASDPLSANQVGENPAGAPYHMYLPEVYR